MEHVLPDSSPLFRRILIALGKSLLFGGLSLLFIIVLAVPLGTMIPPDQADALASGDMSTTMPWVLNLIYLVVVIGILIGLLIVRKLISQQSFASAGLGFKRWELELGEGSLLGAGLVTIGYLILWSLGMAHSEGFNLNPATFMGWLLLFLLQPFAEELVFRGYLMSLLTRYFNVTVAIIISSIGFALVHAANDEFTLIGFLTIAIAGVLFALLFLKTGQLWLATGMHAAWNFVQGVVFGFPTSGIRTYSITQTTASGPDWLSGGAFGFEGSIIAIILIFFAIWWYRDSFAQEKLSAVLFTPTNEQIQAEVMEDILDQNISDQDS